jgi:tetratricopeptide (TPR) repeat protein
LSRAITSFENADTISRSSNNLTLSGIVEVIGKLKQPEKAFKLLEKASIASNKIQDPSEKATALSSIAREFINLKNLDEAVSSLYKAISSYDKINDTADDSLLSKQGSTLSSIVEVIGKLKQPEKAFELLEKASIASNKIQYPTGKASALSAIATVYFNLKQTDKAVHLLEKSTSTLNQVDGSISLDEVNDLIRLAEAIGKIRQPEKLSPLFEKIIDFVSQIQDSSYKATALIDITSSEANLTNWVQAYDIASKCPSDECKVESLSKILTIYAEKQHPELKDNNME